MLVDADGNVATSVLSSNIDEETSDKKWIVVAGCNFDLINKSEEQLVNFSQDNFTLTIPDVTNQWEVSDTGNITIEIYQAYDELIEELSKLSDGPTGFIIASGSFSIVVRELKDSSIATTNTVVGENTDNQATFRFTPITPISTESGRIEI